MIARLAGLTAAILLCCSGVPAQAAPDPSIHNRAAEALVRAYYAAYEARDARKLAALFTDDARIVRFQGQQIDVSLLLGAVRALPAPKPERAFKVDNFEVVDAGDVVVVSFDLEGYSDATGLSDEYSGLVTEAHRYRASWFLVPSAGGYRIGWAVDVPYGIDDGTPSAVHPASLPGVRPPLSDVRDEAAMKAVEHFFDVFLSGPESEMPSLFLPEAKIIHMQGEETSIGAFLKMMAADAQTPPPKTAIERPRPGPFFDHITTRHYGDYVLVSFDNHVWHWREGHDQIALEHAFRENWLVKLTPEGPKVQWVIYPQYGVVPAAASGSHLDTADRAK